MSIKSVLIKYKKIRLLDALQTLQIQEKVNKYSNPGGNNPV